MVGSRIPGLLVIEILMQVELLDVSIKIVIKNFIISLIMGVDRVSMFVNANMMTGGTVNHLNFDLVLRSPTRS